MLKNFFSQCKNNDTTVDTWKFNTEKPSDPSKLSQSNYKTTTHYVNTSTQENPPFFDVKPAQSTRLTTSQHNQSANYLPGMRSNQYLHQVPSSPKYESFLQFSGKREGIKQRISFKSQVKGGMLGGHTEPMRNINPRSPTYEELLEENRRLKYKIQNEYKPMQVTMEKLVEEKDNREYLISRLQWKIKQLANQLQKK